MGLRGPEPTPFEVLKARGSRLIEGDANDRGGRDIPIEVGAPDMPDYLPDPVRAIWEKTVPMLVKMRVLSPTDGPALERYCFLLFQWREVVKQISAVGWNYLETVYVVGVDVDAATGKPKREAKKVPRQLPLLKTFDTLCTQLSRAEMQFGLNPSARSRIIAPPQDTGKKKEPGDKRRFLAMG